ncbi:MAG: helix-turn-helix transcriptional regulator [Burkholderiales bacterium]
MALEMSKRKIELERSSGNVFADLDLPDAQDRLAKAELAREIGALLTRKGLSQSDAARLLGVDQPKVSALLRGRLSGFSLERLIRFLNLLGQDVRIVVRPKSSTRGPATLVVSGA